MWLFLELMHVVNVPLMDDKTIIHGCSWMIHTTYMDGSEHPPMNGMHRFLSTVYLFVDGYAAYVDSGQVSTNSMYYCFFVNENGLQK